MQVDGTLSVTAMAGLHNSDEGLIDVRGTLALGASTVLRNRVDGMITGSGQISGTAAAGAVRRE